MKKLPMISLPTTRFCTTAFVERQGELAVAGASTNWALDMHDLRAFLRQSVSHTTTPVLFVSKRQNCKAERRFGPLDGWAQNVSFAQPSKEIERNKGEASKQYGMEPFQANGLLKFVW